MKIIRSIQELRQTLQAIREQHHQEKIGFVPTMGFLHEGHASLMKRAREENETVVLSIFVNPLQFGPAEDYEVYPRDEEHDAKVAQEAGVDMIFMPSVAEMYPQPVLTRISVPTLTGVLCGASRPGHFDGVATVVLKLLHIVEPDRVYFGMKDAQQVAVVSRLISDLSMRTEIVPCDIVREPDGLAMSSRNVYLKPEERKQALVLSESLQKSEEWIRERGMTAKDLKQRIRDYISRVPLADIDYVEVFKYPSLAVIENPDELHGSKIIVALAVKFGNTRLIDNRILE